MDERTFFAQPQSGCNRETLVKLAGSYSSQYTTNSTYQSKGLDSKRPGTHEMPDDGSSEDCLDFGNSAMSRIDGKPSYQKTSTHGK